MAKKKLSEMTGSELAATADAIEARARDKRQWRETPASKRRGAERAAWLDSNTTLISIRMPAQMLEVLRAVAEREGIGYQTLIKRWLNERIEAVARERKTPRRALAAKVEREAEDAREAVARLARRR